MSFSAKRCAYCPRPSFSSQSDTCCIAQRPGHPLASANHPKQFGKKQHSTVQRLLRALRKTAVQRLIAETAAEGCETIAQPPGLWTARAMEGPTRPQPFSLSSPQR